MTIIIVITIIITITAYMLESTNVAKLMRKIKDANEQDVQSRIRAVEQAVTFSEHQGSCCL